MKTTFTTNTSNTIYEANETMTYCWKFPFGEKGKRVRISKGEFLEAQRIHEQEQEEALQRIIEEAKESATTEEIKEIVAEMTGEETDMEQELEVEARMLENYCRHPEGSDLEVPAVINEFGCVDCSKCNVQNCVHRDCMRRNPTNKGGLAECPRLKVKAEEPKQPKAKKVRKSKDAFHTSIAVPGLTLTAKQTSFLLHLSDTNFWENGLDSCIWVDILCDEIGGEFAGKPMTVGAMISTLCEKGLGTRGKDRVNGRKCTSFALTELGKKVAAEVGLQ